MMPEKLITPVICPLTSPTSYLAFVESTGKKLVGGPPRAPPPPILNRANKVANLKPATLLKKDLWNRCFPLDFAKFLRTTFL